MSVPNEPETCDGGCAEALAQLWAYLDSELGDLDATRVRQHLDACAGCLSEYQVEVVLKKVLRRGCAEQAPQELRLRIHERLTWRP